MPHHPHILILGNSGSGKSTLARRLVAERNLAHLDLDTLAWQPVTPPERTPLEEAGRKLETFIASHQGWVIEGCYADLLGLVSASANEFIFLDLSVDACKDNTRSRPWEPHKYPSKEAQDANLAMLLDWISGYPEREGPLGRKEHLKLFDGFDGKKSRLESLSSIDEGR